MLISVSVGESPVSVRVAEGKHGIEPGGASASLARVDGWGINTANMAEAVRRTIDAAKRGEGFAVVTLNLDHLVKLRRNDGFRRAYAAARIVTADGAPVAALARLQNRSIERTAGADLLVPLVEAAAEAGLAIYLYGSRDDVLARAGRALAGRCEGRLDIVGSSAPGADFDPTGPEADAAIARIKASGARLVLLALGAPKQEIFAARAVEQGVHAGFVCIGAALDFIVGAQVRAPELMQRHGLEWLWRLATNPRRLAARYAQCALLLADLTLVDPVRQRLSGSR